MSGEPANSEMWMGIGKLIEECGEVLQLCGKLILFPDGDHPDGNGDLSVRIEEELADLHAAMRYFILVNNLNTKRISERSDRKMEKFHEWQLVGLKS